MSPKIHWDIEQGTPEWNAMRAGKWGSSKANVIMGGLTTDGLANLIKDVAWGRVFGPPDDGYRNAIMERGSLMEPESRDWYAFERRVVIREAGLVVARPVGARRLYRIDHDGFGEVRAWVDSFWDEVLTAFAAHTSCTLRSTSTIEYLYRGVISISPIRVATSTTK